MRCLKYFASLFFTVWGSAVNAQILNGDFSNENNSCNVAPQHWTYGRAIQVSDIYQSYNYWIDITGCQWGNGSWMEQVVTTTPGTLYKIRMDLGSWYDWDKSDAGIIVSIDGQSIGRYYNDSFSLGNQKLRWQTVTTCAFMATGKSTTVRLTADGKCTSYSPPGTCAGPNPGVIAVDNIHFCDSFRLQVDSVVCLRSDSAFLSPGFDRPGLEYTSKWYMNDTLIRTDNVLKVDTPGIYKVEITAGCGVPLVQTVKVNLAPLKFLGKYFRCIGDTLKIAGKPYFGSGYYYIPGSSQCDSLTAFQLYMVSGDTTRQYDSLCKGEVINREGRRYDTVGTFKNTLKNYRGCDSMTVLVITAKSKASCECAGLERVPNVFSPNGDGANDYFPLTRVNTMKLWVFDRWGILVHYSEDGLGWNGMKGNLEMATGTYYYMIEYGDCGRPQIQSHGVITLVR